MTLVSSVTATAATSTAAVMASSATMTTATATTSAAPSAIAIGPPSTTGRPLRWRALAARGFGAIEVRFARLFGRVFGAAFDSHGALGGTRVR